jgi:hypothetical protein
MFIVCLSLGCPRKQTTGSTKSIQTDLRNINCGYKKKKKDIVKKE